MKNRRTLLLAVSLALAGAALAGCFEVRENSEPVGDEVSNDGGPSQGADYGVVDPADGQCISSTTGEPTTDADANSCPQGQVSED